MSTRLLTTADVLAKLAISRSTLYELKERPDFPRPVRLTARTIRYREDEIEKFLKARQERPTRTPNRMPSVR